MVNRLLMGFATVVAPAVVLAASLLLSPATHANLLLTGEIASKNSEAFYAPRVTGWQTQIEWMMPEGEIAKPGDLVVLFERSNLDSDIEIKEADILRKIDQLKLAKNKGSEDILTAEFVLTKAELEYEKSKIDAGIGVEYVSAYDHEKAKIDLEKRLMDVDKARRNLVTTRLEVETDIKKKQTAIAKVENELALLKKKSELTAVKTKHGGPMVYANHPWNGSKLVTGTSVQATWKVAEVASNAQMQVVAWLNEVDKESLKKGAKVNVSVDALPGNNFSGVVRHIVPQAEEKEAWGSAAYFKVEVDIDNSKEVPLVPGMSVLVEVL